MSPLNIASLINSGFNLANDLVYNNETPLSSDATLDIAMRGNPEDRHILNQLGDLILTGNGLWGTSSKERNFNQGMQYLDTFKKDFSQVNNRDNLLNVMDANTMYAPTVIANDNNREQQINARVLNDKSNRITAQNYASAYNQFDNIAKREQRQAMMNYFDNGGSLDELNGVTSFNVGGNHSQNPYEGIQQGIASDGNPNLVEEGEKKYKDYIYSARLKPSKSLLKEFNLPEKYAGLTFAEVCDKLQKESEDRPNDPISLQTLNDWMSRLAGAQEEYKAKAAERKLARELDKMSDEEKAIIMSSLVQPMTQQEGYDLGQPMYADGGHLFPLGGFPLPKTNGFGEPVTPQWGLGIDYSQLDKYNPKYNPTLSQLDSDLSFDTVYNYNKAMEGYIPNTAKKGEDISKFKLGDLFNNIDGTSLRYAPVLGSAEAMLRAALQPKDYTLGNEYRQLASQLSPIGTPHLGGFESYHPIDVNLTYSNNLALLANMLNSNRGLNRATKAGIDAYTIRQMQNQNALTNFAAQEYNKKDRADVNARNTDKYKFNIQLTQADNQLNNARQMAKLSLLEKAAATDDASKEAWANMYNTTRENFFNQLGNVGRDEWNRGQLIMLLDELGAEGLKEYIKNGGKISQL